MTLGQAIHRFDTLHPNPYTLEEKVAWLSAAEAMVYNEVHRVHEHSPAPFLGFTKATPLDTPLLVPEPYDLFYQHYLEGQSLYTGGEITAYNNAMVLYNQYLREFWRYYHATHKPLGHTLSVLQ